MALKIPPPRPTPLHTASGNLLATAEATALAAGDTIQYQNTGNVILRIVVTTAGTGTINALNAANNQAVTLSIGDVLIGPLDPAIFGYNVSITTATAVGTVATYLMPTRFANGARNPFETSVIAPDAL